MRMKMVVIGVVAAMLMGPQALQAQGQTEGIKVRGHWVIEVLNPDRSLASRHEFENSLQTVGAERLAGLLSRSVSPGLWTIDLTRRFIGSCVAEGSISRHCSITEPARAVAASETRWVSNNLTLRVNGGALILSGSIVANMDSYISTVSTSLGSCAPGIAPNACTAALGGGEFTRKELETSVSFTQGQILQVTVTLSFS
jgi:hypothetical protein